MMTLLFGALVFSQPVSFAEALEHAPRTPPVVGHAKAAERRATEAEGLRRLTENPTLQVQPGARSLERGGVGGEVYVNLIQPISLGALGKRRKHTVRREVESDAAQARLSLREARLAVAESWLMCWAAQAIRQTAEAEVELAEQLAQRTQAAVDAGESTRVDLAQLRAWHAEARLAALDAEGAQFDQGLDLARSMGLEADGPLETTAALPEIDLPAAQLKSLLLDLDTSPRVQAAEANLQVQRAQLEERRAARRGMVGVGASAWREGGGDVAAVATLELSPPVFDRGQRESAVAAAELARAEQERRAAELSVRTERRRLLHELAHTEAVLRVTERSLVAAAESLAEALRLRLEAGEATSREWVLARREVLQAHLRLARARAAHALARFRIREAVGQKRRAP